MMLKVNNSYNFLNGQITFLILLMFILSFSLVSAEGCAPEGFMGRFQEGLNITITETCPTCTFINISIKDPNSTLLFTNEPMTLANGIFTFDINATSLTSLGTYNIEGFSNLDLPVKACFIITNITTEITIPESLIYIILSFAAFFIFLLCLWGAVVVPFKNEKNEFARIIKIQRLKYLKVALIFLSYLFFVWFVNLMLTMSNNLIALTQYNGFFTMVFNFLIAFAWPMFVIMFLFMFLLGIRDLKLKDLLNRGIKPRE